MQTGIKRLYAGRRCGHPYCDDCRTKHGHNRGNRRQRYAIRRLLRRGLQP